MSVCSAAPADLQGAAERHSPPDAVADEVTQTAAFDDELNVDIAPDGTVYGIELLNANAQLLREDRGKLVIVNEALGGHREISLNEPEVK